MGRPDVIGRCPSARGLEFRCDLRKTIRADSLFRSIGLEPVQNLGRSRSEPFAAGERPEVNDPFVVCRPVGSVPLFGLDRLGRCRRATWSQEVALGESFQGNGSSHHPSLL
jgi:hypothetical protein